MNNIYFLVTLKTDRFSGVTGWPDSTESFIDVFIKKLTFEQLNSTSSIDDLLTDEIKSCIDKHSLSSMGKYHYVSFQTQVLKMEKIASHLGHDTD